MKWLAEENRGQGVGCYSFLFLYVTLEVGCVQRLKQELSESVDISAKDRQAMIERHETEVKAIEAQLALDAARQQSSLEQQLAARRCFSYFLVYVGWISAWIM